MQRCGFFFQRPTRFFCSAADSAILLSHVGDYLPFFQVMNEISNFHFFQTFQFAFFDHRIRRLFTSQTATLSKTIWWFPKLLSPVSNVSKIPCTKIVRVHGRRGEVWNRILSRNRNFKITIDIISRRRIQEKKALKIPFTKSKWR